VAVAQALPSVTLYTFLHLDLGDCMAYVVDNGEFITNDPAAPSNFYAVGDFYVEVQLDTTASEIVAVVPFTKGERYNRMVERIDLSTA
jgi:hypothetical protein